MMGDSTGISWTDATWNPVRGCSRVSEGCRNCYAEAIAGRFCGPGQPYEGLARRVQRGGRWTGDVTMVRDHLFDPLRWKRPRRIFVNSMSDLFHERLTNEEIAAVFGVMAASPRHTFQVLTKRAARMLEWFEWFADQLRNERAAEDRDNECLRRVLAGCAQSELGDGSSQDEDCKFWLINDLTEDAKWPLSNVWLGVSVENQNATNERIPKLLATPAAVRFLSCEPLLGPIELWNHLWEPADRDGTCHPSNRFRRRNSIGWVIAGCESGHGARPCSVEWLRSLRDQSEAARVPFFLKQAEGEAAVGGPLVALGVGSKAKGRGARGARIVELPYLDGVQHAAFPAEAVARSIVEQAK